jgi:hypothetical protein
MHVLKRTFTTAAKAIAELRTSPRHAVQAVQNSISLTTVIPPINETTLLFRATYDGTAQGFQKAVEEAKQSQAIHTSPIRDNSDFVLETMAANTNEIDVAAAKAVVIQRLGTPAIVLENTAAPPSGQTLVIPLSSLHASALSEIADMRLEDAVSNPESPWGLMLGGTILFMMIALPNWLRLYSR